MEPWGRREDGFYDNFHFLCNLKREILCPSLQLETDFYFEALWESQGEII